MPTFPTFDRAYSLSDYSYEYRPVVSRTQFYSGNSRQRKYFQKRDMVFSVNHVFSASELSTFKSFVEDDLDNGSLTYDGPYFTSDAEYTGTLEMIEGAYRIEWLTPDHWQIAYQFELKDRDLTEEGNLYDTVISIGTIQGAFDLFSAIEDMVNNNTL